MNLLLFWLSTGTSTIEGCGGGTDCAAVLGSRWSRVFQIPVTAFGTALYLYLIWRVRAPTGRFTVGLTTLFFVTAWFVFVQASLLGRFCPWCMAAHGAAAATLVTGLPLAGWRAGRLPLWFLGFLGAAALALAQTYGPAPPSHQLLPAEPAAATTPLASAPGTAEFVRGTKTFVLSEVPILGRADAPNLIAEYYDYNCRVCRVMAGHLAALLGQHPDEYAVLLLPVPLERACNRSMDPSHESHEGSCELARLILAAWKVRPESLPDLHAAFFGGVTPAEARALAEQAVGAEALAMALEDPWLDQTLASNIRDWVRFSIESPKLPKLLLGPNQILTGSPPDTETLIQTVREQFPKLPTP